MHDQRRDRGFDSRKDRAHDGHRTETQICPRERDQNYEGGQHEQHTCGNPAAGAMHQPPDIGRELLRLRTRQQHAIVQGVKKSCLRNPAPLLHEFAMHEGNLAGGTAEADKAQSQPISERGAERDRGAHRERRTHQ